MGRTRLKQAVTIKHGRPTCRWHQLASTESTATALVRSFVARPSSAPARQHLKRPHEAHALRDLGQGLRPVVLVLDRHGAVHADLGELLQDAPHVRDAQAVGHVVPARLEHVQILQVRRDDAPFERADGVDGLQPGADPVAGVGAGADPRVPVLYQVVDVARVPHPVVRVVGSLRVVVEPDLHVELPHHELDRVDGSGGLGVDHQDAEPLCPAEQLARLLGVLRDVGDAERDRAQAALLQKALELGGVLFPHLRADLGVARLLAEPLAGEELDRLRPGLGDHLDRLLGGVGVEGPRLDAGDEGAHGCGEHRADDEGGSRRHASIISAKRYHWKSRRGVAQFGSALPWGGRGRTFESCRPDQVPPLLPSLAAWRSLRQARV